MKRRGGEVIDVERRLLHSRRVRWVGLSPRRGGTYHPLCGEIGTLAEEKKKGWGRSRLPPKRGGGERGTYSSFKKG